jgi:hypothetical protein
MFSEYSGSMHMTHKLNRAFAQERRPATIPRTELESIPPAALASADVCWGSGRPKHRLPAKITNRNLP